MKKTFISFFSVIITVLIFATCTVFADEGGYEITNYNIDIDVNENNTYDIEENITVNFTEARHGIYREIPITNNIKRLDGSKTKQRATISDISVEGAKFSQYTEGNDVVVKIGNPNKTVKGKKDYTISYLYSVGNDSVKAYDEFYFNIVGTNWNTDISGVEFSITMPKEFDATKLGFSSGKYGEVNNDLVSYEVNGNTISGVYNGTLGPHEALTVRLELPEGYFIKTKTQIPITYIITITISLFFALVTFILWRVYGKDEKVVPILTFYPPNEHNSLEIAFLYNGSVTGTDVMSLLIYLADKGYVKIEELQSKKYSKDKDYRIEKLKEYDGTNEYERDFLIGLFKEKSGRPSNSVTKDDLFDKFYFVVSNIVKRMNSTKNTEKIFVKNSITKNNLLRGMCFIIYCLISYRFVYNEDSLFGIVMIGVSLFIAISAVTVNKPTTVVINGVQKKSKNAKYFTFLITIVFATILISVLILPTLLADFMLLVTYLIGIASIFYILATINYIYKRNEYGYEMLCKIEGFKNFLETTEKDKLEELVMENPTYFYDILPYTYVLGISDTWIEKFESISIEAPNWYTGRGRFTMHNFNGFMGSTMASSTAVKASKSSGGGFSGGGGGGGGGGSW